MNKPKFIESIRIEKGEFQNLHYHQERVDNTSKAFSFTRKFNLNSISLSHIKDDDIYKSRILYSEDEYSMDISKYIKRDISSLKLVCDNDIDYGFKYENRECLDQLFMKREGCSDILIIKNGLITDTSFSNIVLFDGLDYFTPKTYLLNGIMRQNLLERKIIIEKEIRVEDLKTYKTVFLINALNTLYDNLSVEVSCIS